MRSRLALSGSVLALLMLAGCAASIAPAHWLPSALEVPQDGYGSWASVTLSIGPDEFSEGELIASTPDTLYILGYERLEAYGHNEVAKVHLQSYDANYTGLAFWTGIGSLSTISHGFILAISAPVWIITGTIATSSQSKAPHKTMMGGSWKQLQGYCRFPGGMPPSIDRTEIKPKPLKLPELKSPAQVDASGNGT